mgnify:CR=1 FL=1
MANTFTFTLVSPDGKKLVKEADILNVKTTNGVVGILANHADLVAVIEPSILNFKLKGESTNINISGGILHVKDNEVRVLAESYEEA